MSFLCLATTFGKDIALSSTTFAAAIPTPATSIASASAPAFIPRKPREGAAPIGPPPASRAQSEVHRGL